MRKLSHDYFPRDVVRRKSKLYIIYSFACVSRKVDVFPTLRLITANSKFLDFAPHFFPISPSSIQNPPCSFRYLLTVSSDFPMYSAISETITFPFIPQAS